MKIMIATGNNDKYAELSAALKEFGIDSEQFETETSEQGDSLEEIAKRKAKQAYAQIGKPLITDDTGVFFLAYDNFPGHKAKRIYREIGFHGLLESLKGRGRKAAVRTVICYTDGRRYRIFSGKLHGRITESVEKGSGNKLVYERIFLPVGEERVMAAMSREEKNAISHRTQAARKFAKWLIKK